jgi:oxygen-dependent protoporphyrinogen oxidase
VLIGAGPSLKALGVLFSSFIFPAQQNKNFLENWIFGGTRSPETLNLTESEISELVAKERASLIQVHEAPQTLRFRKWERGLPHYTTDLERLLSEMQLPKGLYLHGNYLQGIGLSQILERSYKLSEEL